MSYEVAAAIPCELGEGPLWNPADAKLYWTDIEGQTVYALGRDGAPETVFTGRRVGGFMWHRQGGMVLFMDEGQVGWYKNGQLHLLIDGMPGESGSRFNDVIAGPSGSAYAGTMPNGQRTGRLYWIRPDLSYDIVLDGLGCPNGMGYSLDLETMYFIDTSPGRVYAFPHDPESGRLGKPQVAIQFPPGVHPDGMTVDAEGNLWIAFWGGSRVERFTPEGRSLGQIGLPAVQTTAIAFGGSDGTRAFVTSARTGLGTDPNGHLFEVRTGVAGRPEFHTDLGTRQ